MLAEPWEPWTSDRWHVEAKRSYETKSGTTYELDLRQPSRRDGKWVRVSKFIYDEVNVGDMFDVLYRFSGTQ